MKKIATSWKYLKYLFWLGPCLIIAGLTAGFVSNWAALSLGLLIAGVVITGLWLLFIGQTTQGFWRRRSTQAGTNAIIATLAVVVILGLVNFLGARHAARIDLTENQLFTLAPESQQVVENLQQPIKVVVFDVVPNPVDQKLLENYRRQGEEFSFEYVDPQANPRVTQEFGASTGEVYLQIGEEQPRLLQRISQEERLSERRLTSALEQTTSDRQAQVYFLQGHGESSLNPGEEGLSQAIAALQEKNYRVDPLNLAESTEIPADASVVVVAGPKRTLFEAEITALSNFVNQGGGLLLMVDPNTTPGLESLLQDWGVNLANRLIIDNSGSGQLLGLGPAAPLITQYGNHPITEDFGGSGISFYPLSRPVEVTPEPEVESNPILITNEGSQAETILESGDVQFNPETDPQGSLLLGVALSRPASESELPQPEPEAALNPETPSTSATPSPTPNPTPEASPTTSPNSTAETPQAEDPTDSEDTTSESEVDPPKSTATSTSDNNSEARLVVIGNSSFATDGLFEQQLNGDVFLNSVTWLSQQDNAVLSLRPREATNRRIVMTPQQQIVAGLTSLLLLPLLGFGTALIVWLRRR